MFLEIFYILSFISIPFIVFLLKIRISNSIVVLGMAIFGLPFFLELFEFIQLHVYVHDIVILSLYVLVWHTISAFYVSIKHKVHRILCFGFSIFLHLVCVIFLIFNHFITFLNSPTYTTIHDNIYAIETRNGGAWADENMVKIQILQSFGILSLVKFSESYIDTEVKYLYEEHANNLKVLLRKGYTGDFYETKTISF